MYANQVFAEFDTDGSGFLDYEEFSRMLPEMGIYLPPTKVVRHTPLTACSREVQDVYCILRAVMSMCGVVW